MTTDCTDQTTATARLRALCIAAGVRVSPLDYVREGDLARLLGVTGRTVKGWRYAGEGPQATRIGAAHWYSLHAIAAYLGKNEEKAGSPGVDDGAEPAEDGPGNSPLLRTARNESRTNGQRRRPHQHRSSAAQQQDGE